LLAKLTTAPGLCGECAHVEFLASARSSFVRCGLARIDARFSRYPPLPVRVCAGFRRPDEPQGGS
jgi:hypothetical protein